jgi:hypothetical protein
MDKLQAKPSGPALLLKAMGIDVAAIETQAKQFSGFVTALVAQMETMDKKLDRIESLLVHDAEVRDRLLWEKTNWEKTNGNGTDASATGPCTS